MEKKDAGVQDVAQRGGHSEQGDNLEHLQIADDDVHDDQTVQADPAEKPKNQQGGGKIDDQKYDP